MNIELKQAAQDATEAIDWLLKNIRRDAPQLSGKAMGNAEKCASALRTALAQQPATGELQTETFVQQVPDHCDRVLWRGRYLHLPMTRPENVAAKQDAASLNWIERQHLEELGMGLVIDAPNDGMYYVCGDSGTTHYGKTLREALASAVQQAEAKKPATGEPVKLHKECATMPNDERCDECQQTTPVAVQTTPNFTQLMQILDGLNRCHSRDSKVEFLRSWIRDWTQHKVDKLTHPAPSLPDAITPPTEDGTEYDYASGYTAGYAAGWNEYRDGIAWLLDAK